MPSNLYIVNDTQYPIDFVLNKPLKCKCERCFEPLYIRHDVNFKDPHHRDDEPAEIKLCHDCYEIVRFAASPESCGDLDMVKAIQDVVVNPPPRIKKKKGKKDFSTSQQTINNSNKRNVSE